MKAHEDLKAYLVGNPGKAFAIDVTHRVYDWSWKIPLEAVLRYKVFEELSIRYATGDKTRKGLKKMEHYRFDAVFFIQPGQASLNQGECFTVGVELKSTKSDLMGDKKMDKYLGWTDLFFIGVPEGLVDEAILKAEEVSSAVFGSADMVGVVAVDTGIIYKIPVRRQQVSQDNRIAVYEQIIYNQVFNMTDAVTIPLEEIGELQRMPGRLELSTSVVATALTPPIDDGLSNEKTQPERTALNVITPPKSDVLKEETALPLPPEDRTARYAAAKARQDAHRLQMEQMSERAAKLTADARGRLMGQTPKTQKVFWAIADAAEPIKAGAVRTSLGFGANTMDRAVSALLASNLIRREGSKKSGGYVVTPLGQCGTSCGTCAIALKCPNHQPM